MGTTTLNTILPQFARYIGAYIGSFSTTTNITTSTALISTGLTAYFEDNDTLNDTFVRILGTENDGVVRSVLDHTGSTGALDLRGVNLAAESGSKDFEIYRYDPTILLEHLNDARLHAFPSLYKKVHDRTLTGHPEQRNYLRPTSIQPHFVRKIYVEDRIPASTYGDNIVSSLDCDFEGDLSDWSNSNITLSAEAETTGPDNYVVFAGQQSGKMVVGASSVGTSYLTVASPTNYDGEELNVSVWVYSKTASRVSAAISIDSGSATTGSTHSGRGWERLTVSTNLSDVSSSIRVGVHATSGTALVIYADELIAIAGPSESPRTHEQPIPNWREEGDDIYIPHKISESKQIVISGMGLLSSLSSGSDTTEIDGQQLQRLYAYAATSFFQGDIDQFTEDGLNAAQRRWTHYNNRIIEGNGAMSAMSMYKVPAF
jgi:hypothetical protein